MNKEKRYNLKVGITGCGNIAKIHLRFILELIPKECIALCDTDLLRLEEFSKNYGIDNKFSELEKMLTVFLPDVVHILTPPSTHKDVALHCLRNNCHILIEKPMCLSVREADEIIRAAKEYNCLVCVDHMRLFDPLILKARKIIESGLLGRITNISAGYSYDFLKRLDTDPASRWINKLPGGAFFDLIPHPLCIMINFLPEIQLIKSAYSRNKDGIITDLHCIFASQQGTGNLHMSLNIYPLKNTIVFECERGILEVDFRNFLFLVRKSINLPNAVERIAGNIREGMQILGGTFSSIFGFLRGTLDPYAGLRFIIKDFYKSVLEGKDSPVSGEKARIILDLCEKIFQQNKEEEASQGEPVSRDAEILVTGGTGFIGRKLVNGLQSQDRKVRVLSHRRIEKQELNSFFKEHVELVRGDIYNYSDVEKACSGVHTIYHLAAAMKGNWNYHLDTTITGTKNVLNVALKKGIRNIVYVSTLNVYDAKNYPKNGVIDEMFCYEAHPEKRGMYSHAKLKAEQIVKEFADNNKGVAVSIIRPGLVYGAEGHLFPKDIGYRINQWLTVVLGFGKRRLPLIFVDNLVDALLLFKDYSRQGLKIYNVVDQEYPSQKEFIAKFNKMSGKRFHVVYIPFWFVSLIFWALEKTIYILLKKRLFLSYKLRCISRNVKHSTASIERDMGWRQKIPFEEGLTISIHSI